MLEAIVVAVLIAIIVGALLVYLLGPIIKTLPAPIAQIAGNFFVTWGWGIGVLVGLLWFFTGGSFLGFGKH
jgi:hypothetical protein